MRSKIAQSVAFGGIFGAVAIVIMNMGGLIPIATYICPMLCTILLQLVYKRCGVKIGLAWYVLVSLLSLLMGPDKEAAAVFVVIGYYPILKPIFERSKLSLLWKILLFNTAILLLYSVLIHVFGMAQIVESFEEFGKIGAVVMLFLGNVTFFLLDRALVVVDRKLAI